MDNFKKRSLKIISKIKEEKLRIKLPIKDDDDKVIAFLRPVTRKVLNNKRKISLLAKWRKENSFAFPSQFKVTFSGTKLWLNNQLINNRTRTLFFIETNKKKPILVGHMGLYSFDFKNESCEIDNVIRGEKKILKGVMSFALKTLIDWAKKILKPKNIYLRVFSDNDQAINYYKKCGFLNKKLIPLRKIIRPGITLWQEDNRIKKTKKYFLNMIFKKI